MNEVEELKALVKSLEDRIKLLEARPVYYPVPYYIGAPIACPQPYQPVWIGTSPNTGQAIC